MDDELRSVRGQEIRIKGAKVAYGSNVVIEDLSLDIGAGQFFTLLGPSGCGKTTTLRLVAGLVGASAGEIHLGGRNVTRTPVHRRRVAMVFQNYALMPHKSVFDNVAYGLVTEGVPSSERRTRTNEALERVGLSGFGDRSPSQLSGGQQQRVGLARAVAVEPGVMLLDEPLSNLDASLRQQMCLELRDLQRDLGVTILYVTHDRYEALSMSDQIAVMSDGEVVGLGSPQQLYEQPTSLRVARMLGDVFELRGSVTKGQLHLGGSVLRAEHRARDGEAVWGVRPDNIAVVPEGETSSVQNVLHGTVRRLEYAGAYTNTIVDVNGLQDALVARVPASHAAQVPGEGQPVTVGWKVHDTLVLSGG